LAIFKGFLNYKSLILILFILQLLYLLVGINSIVNIYDEGVTVYGATRILEGDVPYKDFWTLYAPGQYYVLAAMFKLFGTSVLTERLWDTLARLMLAFLVFLLSRKLTSNKIALIPWFISIIWLQAIHFYGYAMFPALAFSLLAILFLFYYFEKPQKSLLLACGIAVGLAALFRHDTGAYDLLVFGIMLIAFTFANLAKDNFSLIVKLMSLKALLPFFAGILIVVALPVIYLISAVPIDTLVYDLIIFPITVFPKVRSLPWPSFSLDTSINDLILFYFPAFVYLASIVTIVLQIRQVLEYDKIKLWGVMVLTLFGLLLYSEGLNRGDRAHLLPGTIIATILLLYMISLAIKRYRKDKVLIVAFLLLLLPITIFIILPVSTWLLDVSQQPGFTLTNCIRRIGCVEVNHDEEEAAKYIVAHTGEGERIFVGLSRHDVVVLNDAFFYFLANRDSASKYQELHPGVITTLPVQKEIVNDLKNQKVSYLVLFSQPKDFAKPNEGGRSTGVVVLDKFIREKYQVVEEFGYYTVWKIKSTSLLLSHSFAAQE